MPRRGRRIDRLVGEVIVEGSAGCTCWPGGTSTTPTPAAPRSTPTSSCAAGPTAGLDIVHRTSAAVGLPAEADRNGYRVVRRGSRYSVFPRTAVSELTGRMGRSDALIEIWNGVPWFSPVWYRRPHMTILHHVHGPMWDQIMPGPLAGAGRFLEARLAPPFYRRSAMVTPSEATREELLELGFRPERVTAVDNGVDPFFTPGGEPHGRRPVVVAVGRLAPVKRFELAARGRGRARESRARPAGADHR